MKSSRQIALTKRDGTVERFSMAKLRNCLATVMSGQAYDPGLAGPLARAIAMHLEDWHDSSPPTSGYVYRCLRSVLRQTGLGPVADDLGAHRLARQQRRSRIRVFDEVPARGPGRRWRKSVIVKTLQGRYGLRHSVSRFLAGQVETQVFGLDYRMVTKPFLSELVRSETLAWGLAPEHAAKCEPPVGSGRQEKEN